MCNGVIYRILMFFLLLGIPFSALADSLKDLVDRGNVAYLAGNYDEALKAYEEASVEASESPIIYFNKGAALYQKGNYASASESFEKAALKSRHVDLEAKSQYNLGNCAFKEAERQKDNDLNKAVAACGKSIQHCQKALSLDPNLKEAAENIEVVRLVMKNILDEINKRKKDAQKRQDAQRQLEKEIKALIEKQQQALDRNLALQKDQKSRKDSEMSHQRMQELAREQTDIRKQTEATTNKAAKIRTQPPAEENLTQKHLNNAVTAQTAASGNLRQDHPQESQINQEKAVQELQQALDSLKKKGQQKGPQQNQSGQQQKQQAGEQLASSPEPQHQEKPDKEKPSSALSKFKDDAEDILDEEKENRKRRRVRVPGTYRDVEKDW